MDKGILTQAQTGTASSPTWIRITHRPTGAVRMQRQPRAVRVLLWHCEHCSFGASASWEGSPQDSLFASIRNAKKKKTKTLDPNVPELWGSGHLALNVAAYTHDLYAADGCSEKIAIPLQVQATVKPEHHCICSGSRNRAGSGFGHVGGRKRQGGKNSNRGHGRQQGDSAAGSRELRGGVAG